VVRYLVPLVVLCNIGLFLSGHLNVGGTVKVDGELFGESIVIDRFFEFSIARSTVDLWNAGGRVMAVLILLFSGVWPYTKQLVTLFLWFASPQTVSVSTRGSLLEWLDFLTKWSSVDIFVLIISLVAFRLTIESPTLEFLPPNFYSLEAFVLPLWGLYANLIAQILTQLTSHLIIHYHRKVVSVALEAAGQLREGNEENGMDQAPEAAENGGEEAIESNESDNENGEENGVEKERESQRLRGDDSKDILMNHEFARPHRGEYSSLTIRELVNPVITVTGIVICVCIIVGCALPSFSIDILGLLGVAIEFGQEFRQAVIKQGVFSIVNLLVNQGQSLGEATHLIGMIFISVVLIFTVVVAPLVQTTALWWNWMMPMTARARGKLEVVVEILQSWQYVEVYLIAVLVSAWQLGQVSEFLINRYCDGLEDTFSTLLYYGILREDDAQCFRVRAHVEAGTYILILSAFALAFLETFVMRALFQYQRDKAAEEDVGHQDDCGLDETTTQMIETMDVDETVEKITPAPVMFSDLFRWLLTSEKDLVPVQLH